MPTNKIIIHPDVEPITLDEMREMLGIMQDDDIERDAVILLRITAVRRLCEIFTGRAFVEQSRLYVADRFCNVIDLTANVMSVTSVRYIDTDGTLQTLDTAIYKVNQHCNRLELAYGQSWPDTRAESDAVQIEYVCGYGDPEDVPQYIKEAIKFWVAQWENYQSGIESGVSVQTMPYAVSQILSQDKDYRFVS